MTFPPMRTQLEIQLKHDMLMDVVSDKRVLWAVVPPEYHAALAMATDALCWVLHHDVDSHANSHASDFARILQDIQEDLGKAGYVWEPPEGSEYIVDQDG